MSKPKEYGLIIPGKNKKNDTPKANFTKPSVFGSDSESDEGPMLPKMKPNPMAPGATERRQARAIQEKALAENPTIFQYDELYDEIENKRNEEKIAKGNEVKKPKYIQRLLQHADRRKLENERRLERQVQREREAEGEEFKDKEAYVTAAYRKKLEELQEAEEKEKREDYLEAIGDVTKQRDLGGFYRHIYEQKLGPKETEVKNSESTKSNTPENILIPKICKPRTYRKHQLSDDEKEQESTSASNNPGTKSHIQSNLDADSDFSIDSSSDSEDNIENVAKNESSLSASKTIIKKIDIKNESESENKLKDIEIKEEFKEENKKNHDSEIEIKSKEVIELPKIDIWKKRTVGSVLEEALQRYYERKAARNSSRFQ